MTGFAKWMHVVSLALWLGSIAFFSFAVAPVVFAALPRREAGQVVSAIFPLYYVVGYGCGVALLGSALVLRHAAGPAATRWSVTAGIATLMLVATLYAGLIVQPRAGALRGSLHDPGVAPTVKEEFDQLHRRAVQLNAIVLVGGLVITGLTAVSLRP